MAKLPLRGGLYLSTASSKDRSSNLIEATVSVYTQVFKLLSFIVHLLLDLVKYLIY